MQIASGEIKFDIGMRIGGIERADLIAIFGVEFGLQKEGAGFAVDDDAQCGNAGAFDEHGDVESVGGAGALAKEKWMVDGAAGCAAGWDAAGSAGVRRVLDALVGVPVF